MAMIIDIEKFISSLIERSSGITQQIFHSDLLNALKEQGLEYKNGEIVKTQRKVAAEAKEALYDSIWCRANGDYLPPKDKPVIVLIQHDYMERTEYAVSFAHIVDTSLYAVNKYIPEDYNGWNIPDVKYWLDLDLPKEE